jgi:hypothetical protein
MPADIGTTEKNSPTLWDKGWQYIQSFTNLDPQEHKVTLATQEELVAYKHEAIKAAFDPSQASRSLGNEISQVCLIQNAEQRVALSLKAQFLQGVRRSQEKEASKEWIAHTQDQMRSTARVQDVWQGRSGYGMILGQVGPLAIGQWILKLHNVPLPDFLSFAKDLLPQTKAQIEELRKSVKGVFAQYPTMYCTQQGQIAKTLGEAEQLGCQTKGDKSSKEADAASGAKSEIKQDESRMVEAAMALIRTSSEVDQRIASTGG